MSMIAYHSFLTCAPLTPAAEALSLRIWKQEKSWGCYMIRPQPSFPQMKSPSSAINAVHPTYQRSTILYPLRHHCLELLGFDQPYAWSSRVRSLNGTFWDFEESAHCDCQKQLSLYSSNRYFTSTSYVPGTVLGLKIQ